jgi:hypothetical protein
VEAGENGALFAIVEDRKLMKLKFDSTMEWSHNARHHHDIAIAENKNIYSIIRKDDIEFYHGIPLPLLNDYIAVLDPNGKLIAETSIYDLMKGHVKLSTAKNIYKWVFNPRVLTFMIKGQLGKRKFPFLFWEDTPLDVFHTNAIELTDRSIAGFCNKEDWLLSIRQLDTVCLVNPRTMQVTWEWGPKELSKQHNPTLLKNGNILIFDNGFKRRWSRIVELDPVRKKVVWEYKANPPEHFFSRSRGGAQRLENGNTLITETDSGHVFEVTPKGNIVWEFYNPEKQRNQRAVIYRMNRMSLTPDVLKIYSQPLPAKN